MGTLALISLCIGAALGLRFKVFALFPVIFLGFIVITAWGLSLGQAGWSIVLLNVVGVACLQFGYLGGTLPRFLIIAERLSRAENPQPVRPLAH
jgi:cellulose synthase/poly-beta-1,6-N-acetylglucosamine synthase-like glycosyltransferase